MTDKTKAFHTSYWYGKIQRTQACKYPLFMFCVRKTSKMWKLGTRNVLEILKVYRKKKNLHARNAWIN